MRNNWQAFFDRNGSLSYLVEIRHFDFCYYHIGDKDFNNAYTRFIEWLGHLNNSVERYQDTL